MADTVLQPEDVRSSTESPPQAAWKSLYGDSDRQALS